MNDLIALRSGPTTATVCPYGAQVLALEVAGQPLLWSLPATQLAIARAAGKAMRGGIPVCWPWVGPYRGQFGPVLPGLVPTPQHGWARLNPWRLVGHGPAWLELELDATPLADVPLVANLRLSLTPHALQLALTTHNRGAQAIPVGAALHGYVAAGAGASVHGVQALPRVYLPTNEALPPLGAPLTHLAGRDDWLGPLPAPVQLHQPGRAPVQVASSSGLIIWQPNAAQASTLSLPGNRVGFVCLEPALPPTGVMVPPGACITLHAAYGVLEDK